MMATQFEQESVVAECQGQPTVTVVIPARDEEANLGSLLRATSESLAEAEIPYDLLVVDDYSRDDTAAVTNKCSSPRNRIRLVENELEPGFGNAIQWGIRAASGDIVVIMMADGSDRPADVVRYYEAFDEKVDCVFGSRFEEESQLIGYPALKFVCNRLGNALIRLLWGYSYSDITNAFKAYRAGTLKRVLPLTATGFEANLEIPLKVLRSGATAKEVPVSWEERSAGTSKMNVLRDTWRYLGLLLRCRSVV